MKLGLFFTFNISVSSWIKEGLFDREKDLYEKLIEAKAFDKIYWFTYGADDKKYQHKLLEGIEIIPLPKIFNNYLGKLIYSIILPIYRNKIIKDCNYLKTNQNLGSWSVFLSNKKILARSGYLWSLFEKNKYKKILAKLVEKKLYKKAYKIIVASEDDAKYVKNNYKISEEKIRVIHNYINTNKFKPGEIKNNNKIIFVGRLNKQKNLNNLLLSLKDSDYILDIYGDGELKDELINLAKKEKTLVNFKGRIANDELAKIINDYSLFIIPSLYEGMPKSLLEAMSAGLACLGSNVVGIKEVLTHGLNGHLVETDSKSIREGIDDLMGNLELRTNLGKNARKTINDKFSLDKIIIKEKKLYK